MTASILYDPPSPSTKQKTIIHSGLNNPKNSFDLSKQYFMSDVSAVRREGAKTALNDIANILGFFDITLYGAGQSLAILENEFLSKLCAITGRSGSDCNISNFYHEQQILTKGGGYASLTGWEDSDSMSPSAFVFVSVFDDYRYQSLLMHEYFHIYQGHSMIGMNLGTSDNPKAPTWFIEGSASYVGEWLSREKGYQSNYPYDHYGWSVYMDDGWGDAVRQTAQGHDIKNWTSYKSASNPNGYDASKGELAQWGIGYAIELAGKRSGISNGAQAVLIDLINDIDEKGWQDAFLEYVGISEGTFYTQYASLLIENDKSTRLANLITYLVDEILKAKHNYSVIQISGSRNVATGGGQATNAKRTVYFYTSDITETPSWTGSNWPYVQSDENAQITKDSAITAEISINTSGQVLIKNKAGYTRPIYQYTSDSDGSKSGSVSTNWSAIRFDGTAINPNLVSN